MPVKSQARLGPPVKSQARLGPPVKTSLSKQARQITGEARAPTIPPWRRGAGPQFGRATSATVLNRRGHGRGRAELRASSSTDQRPPSKYKESNVIYGFIRFVIRV